MKRLFFLTMILVLGLGTLFAGCNKNKGDEGDPNENLTPPVVRTDPDGTPPPCTTGPLCVTGNNGTETLCEDLLDNDGDGSTDCADPDCSGNAVCPANETACNDVIDNDNDGAADCDDTDCNGNAACGEHETACNDVIDNDGDGATDCDDDDCDDDAACGGVHETECGNGTDDDSDGAADCDDTDCYDNAACGGLHETECGNEADDDGDGATDCADDDCLGTAVCTHEEPGTTTHEVKISELDGDDEPDPDYVVVQLRSALNGENYGDYEIVADGGGGSYTWTVEELTAEELAGITGNVINRMPAGMVFVLPSLSAGAVAVRQVATINGRPRDEQGTYAFKVKVTDNVYTDNDSGEYISDYRIFKIHLASKIVIDVYAKGKISGQWKMISLRTFGDSTPTGYVNAAVVDQVFNLLGSQTLKLVARGSESESYRWCLWGGIIPQVCSSTGDVSNGYFKLSARNPSKIIGRPFRIIERISNNSESVRYLSAGVDFEAPTGGNATYPITADDGNNASVLYFKAIDFDCHGQLHGVGGRTIHRMVEGNMGRNVSKRVAAYGGSEGAHYEWTPTLSKHFNFPTTASWTPGVKEKIRNKVYATLDDDGDDNTTKEVDLQLDLFDDITLGQYVELLRRDYLFKTTVNVTDPVCGGSASYEIKYKLRDMEFENGREVGGHLYRDSVNDMHIEVSFKEDDPHAVDHADAFRGARRCETYDIGIAEWESDCEDLPPYASSKMRVILKKNLDPDDPDNCRGDPSLSEEKGYFEYDLGLCNYVPDEDGGGHIECTGNFSVRGAGNFSVRGASKIEDIDEVCLKFTTNNGESLDADVINIKLATPHWETTFTDSSYFYNSNIVNAATSPRTDNITPSFVGYPGSEDAGSLKNKWKFKSD